MNSSENIYNALQVMYKTYENIQKLMEYTKIVANEKTDYIISSPKFLRKKSDNVASEWLINDFILLFQYKNDSDCLSGNKWKNGPVYSMEIYLGDEDNDPVNTPNISSSKFVFDNINSWNQGFSTTEHWLYNEPLWNLNSMNFKEENDYCIGTPKTEKISYSYKGLKKVTFYTLDLLEVNSENLQDKIFGTFDKLRNLV